MKNFHALVLALFVALAIMVPLVAVVITAPAAQGTAIVHIADGPTPTPTVHTNGGESSCHGGGC